MKCKICDSAVTFFARAKVLEKYDVDYFQCKNCNFIQTEAPYWLEEAYINPIAKSDYGLAARNIAFSRLTASVALNVFNPKGKFLDYGSGYGLLGILMQYIGLNFYGYDKYCKSVFTERVVTQPEEEPYQLVTAFEVFEHFTNPLQEISKILEFSRNILLSTELLPHNNPTPEQWGYYATHEGQHIAIYTVKSLEIIAKKFNLNLYTDGCFIHLLTEKRLPSNVAQILNFPKYGNIFDDISKTLWGDIYVGLLDRNNKINKKHKNSILKIVLDGVFFQYYRTGIARVWRTLLEEWVESGFSKHLLVLSRGGTTPEISGIDYRVIPNHNYQNSDADRELLQQICDEEGADLFISSYYTTPISTPSVFMAYDMIPEVLGADFTQPMWREKHYGIQHASAYLAISENTARDLVQCFPNIPQDSVKVAHCGVNRIFSLASLEEIDQFKFKYGIAKPYFLLVAPGTGYKNSQVFFKAFAKLCTKFGFELVCTGNKGLLEDELRNEVPGICIHTLPLSDEELRLAYGGAVALVYPSKYEGFGLPVLEALACGCPVITTPNASLPEVAGDAALYVKDDDIEGMMDALCEVQKPSVRQALIEAGLEQAKKFSWSKMAGLMQNALIDATLLPLNLREENWIVFPDWSQSEEAVGLGLQDAIRGIARHPNCNKMTLLIDIQGISQEDANLLVSGVAMNLLLEEDLEEVEDTAISFVEPLGDIQWQALFPHLQGRLILECDNRDSIARVGAESLPAYTLEDSSLRDRAP
ncbi:glycosyltransferase [Lusitaniella coriacea LEGE 07157]|uniref:Glycosyltransferase n=1 Tax=Lusitaniella coriacea LEGE 07157 TaxID=945747 RepID=A0A8J7DVQ5_9CYAN|nr:methyltransferase domain-containing protein [Lusitaniella coriacea]MBE9115971.1 glycosyltransferase [Lusitaniella coriacea LEGE 07157]